MFGHQWDKYVTSSIYGDSWLPISEVNVKRTSNDGYRYHIKYIGKWKIVKSRLVKGLSNSDTV